MDPNQAAAWSAIGALASAVAAGASLFVAWQVQRAQVRSADFTTCLNVVQQLADAQRQVRDATGDEARKFEFIELLNLMEALALLVNTGRSPSATKKVTAKFLEEALSWIAVAPTMAALMKEATTGDNTFGELSMFRQRHILTIRTTSRFYRNKRDAC